MSHCCAYLGIKGYIYQNEKSGNIVVLRLTGSGKYIATNVLRFAGSGNYIATNIFEYFSK